MGTATFTTPGSTTWNAQATSAVVEVWGGGGGGGADGGSGGGGGGYAKATVTGLSIGVNYTVVVGAAGTGATTGSDNATAGGQSYFNTATAVRAAGGSRGITSDDTNPSGGAGTHGTTLYTGGSGGQASPDLTSGGGGGGSAGTASNGNNGQNAPAYQTAGAGGAAVTGGGAGGHGVNASSGGDGTAGSAPGGGGGGGSGDSPSNDGYNGAAGKVVITWSASSPSQSPSVSPSVSPSASPSESPSASPSIPVPPFKVYAAPETAITFKDSGGTVTMTLQNLATTAGRISARYDRGAGSLPRRYYWKFVFQTEGTPAIGAAADLWIVESDGTYCDGNYGTADAAVTVFPRYRHLDWNWVTSASASYNFVRSGIVTIIERYFSIIVQNSTAVSFKNTANVSYVVFTPVPEEVQ